jgi:hypothetical protein
VTIILWYVDKHVTFQIRKVPNLELYLGNTFGSCFGEGYRAPSSVTGTETTEVREPKTKNKISERVQGGAKGMEGIPGQVRERGTPIPSTTSDDVDMMDGQDRATVTGSGTHLGGVVVQKRTQVKNNYAYEKVTTDV